MPPRLADPISFQRGPQWRNRIALSPLTSLQSNPDGTLGEDELRFLEARARGGFGKVMTCAAHVQPGGQGYPNQLGAFSDIHLPGLERLAKTLHRHGAVAAVQLIHAGARSNPALVGTALSPWADPERSARALTTAEIEEIVECFVQAAARCEAAGFDGVELHGAHGYLLCQFLDASLNQRDDRYGGSYENRTRIFREIISGIRTRTGPDFQLGLRLSPERYGYSLLEARQFAGELLSGGELDYLDMSLWDAFKIPDEAEFQRMPLIDWFADLPRKGTRLGVVGKLFEASKAQLCLHHGADFVMIGRGGILHPDYPRQAFADPGFTAHKFPVSRDYLREQELGPGFINYLATQWSQYVAD